ncbi:MAG: DNA-binding protein [Clostridiaceae bacterium]|nr:DNA-binding protein [Clostridiaceae bacterium]
MQDENTIFKDPVHTDVCLWLDYYSDLLSARQRQVLTLYFNEDWSLSEIAGQTGLSRQGVHDQIKRGVTRLGKLESSLQLAARDRQMKSLVGEAVRQEATGDLAGLKRSLQQMLDLLGEQEGDYGLV